MGLTWGVCATPLGYSTGLGLMVRRAVTEGPGSNRGWSGDAFVGQVRFQCSGSVYSVLESGSAIE